MAPSYHSKVTSTQNELSQSFSDISSLPILVDVQRFHENGKLILGIDKSKWLCVRLQTKWLWNGFQWIHSKACM